VQNIRVVKARNGHGFLLEELPEFGGGGDFVFQHFQGDFTL